MYYSVGSWVNKKLNFLKWYLPIHTATLSSRFQQTYYIDAFASSGKDRIKETSEIIDGSPLIALGVDPPFTNYIFIELNGWYYFELLEHVKKHPRYRIANVQMFWDDSNERIPEILSKIPIRIPIFAFLDPEGIEELLWKTVEELAKRGHVHLLVTFSCMGVARSAQRKEAESVLDDFYGVPAWRDIARNRKIGRLTPLEARRAYIKLYMSQLSKYFRYVDNVIFVETKQGKPLYNLLFATQSEVLIKAVQEYKRKFVYV